MWSVASSAEAQPLTIRGTVRDTSGAVVAGALVAARTASGSEQIVISGHDGQFVVSLPAASDVLLNVRAAGFTEAQRKISIADAAQPILVDLSPGSLKETVTVTAARGEQRTGDVPASVTILTNEAVRQSPAIVADDVLRQVPTFSLFRRTSSLASHPTAQGVSLRGIGPSGVSRTLLLLDDIPFNDPFGGWVYWTRVPLETAERVEIVDGPSSSLYGNYAMGGVINIATTAPARRQLNVRAQYGSRNTPRLDLSGGHVIGPVGVIATFSTLATEGYPIVAEGERGLVDENAAVDFHNATVKLEYQPASWMRGFLRANHFRENRDNGKKSTIDGTPEANRTRWMNVSGGLRAQLPRGGELRGSVFVDRGTFHSNFLAVPAANPPRSIGRMTLDQRVPVDAIGTTLQYSHGFGTHFITAGTDWRRVDGDSEEDALNVIPGARPTLHRVSGGTQRILGVYIQDLFQPASRVTLTASARVDSWRNYDGHNRETALVPGTVVNDIPSLPERGDTVVSPRVAAMFRVTDAVSVWGGAGAGFRAPTLNELYRQFRVGATLTLANHTLGPERLLGYEGGITATVRDGLTLRGTLFTNGLKDPVSNVTISTAGTAVTQQRQNLGRTRVSGLQAEVDYRVGGSWRFTTGYFFDDAKVTENRANQDLVGKFLPQVPRHRASARAAYAHPSQGTVALSLLMVGAQFDDDRNTASRELPGYAVVDLMAARSIRRNVELFFGVQNLLDRVYLVGTLPTTVGTPRLVSGGVRLRLFGS